MELNLAALLETIESEVPDRECIVFRDRRLSWHDVGERTRRFANMLREAGLGPRGEFSEQAGWQSAHDHVALYLHNGNEYLEAMLGAYKARAAPVNVNYRYQAAELRYVLADSGARAVVFHRSFTPTLAAVLDDLEIELLLCVEDGSDHDPLPGQLDYEAVLGAASPNLPDELAGSWSGDDLYICYTGGTTGMPKGVLWRQADLLVAALGIRRRDGEDLEAYDELVEPARRSTLRALPAAPLMHGAAHWNAISCLSTGGTVIIQDHPERLDPADIWSTVARERATSLLIVGDPFARPLLDELDRAASDGEAYELSSLRHLLSGGAVLSPSVKAALVDRIPSITIVDVLGSTESGRQGVAQTSARAAGASTEPAFAPSATTVVLDETLTRRLGPGTGEIGWLAQTGRVPLGYLGDPDKSRATFPEIDGVRHAVAGDRARLGADGEVELLGRDSVTINTGGEKVFAEEVETTLKEHPAVFDAVVCGRPSTRWGEEIVAIVELRRGATVTDDELRAHCRARLASYKAPKDVIFLDAVLRSPSGKADYRWARSVASSSGSSRD